MFEPSDSRALLGLAAEVFRRDVLPGLDRERRYPGAMIANAMAIALRQLDRGGEAAERRLLAAVYGPSDRGADMARLANEIRAGTVSDESHAGLARGLRDLVIAELRERNPKFLASRGIVQLD